MKVRQSSRERFRAYRERLQEREQTREAVTPDASPRSRGRSRTAWQLVRRFVDLIGEHRRALLFALATLTVGSLLRLIPPAATKVVVDYVLPADAPPLPLPFGWKAPAGRFQLLVLVTLSVVAITFVRVCVQTWGRWHATRANQRIRMAVRKRAFEQAVRLPLHRVHAMKSGGTASILREDAGTVGDLVFAMIYNPWRAVVQLLGSLAILAWIDWRLLLGALVLIPLVYFTHRTWIRRIRPQFRDIRKQREVVDARATEAFGGIRVVRAFSGQRAEAGRYMGDNFLMMRQELFTWWWSRAIEIVWDTAIPLASACLLMYGGWQVLEGNLTLGDLMTFLVYLLLLLEPLAVLAQSATAFQNGLSGLDRILDLLDEEREAADTGTERVEPAEVRGRMTFEDVHFEYPSSTDAEEDETSFAIRDVSFDVAPGQTIALVGPSGAGKTTLCNLVARFYDPTAGRILLDGRDVREIDVESYRKLLGIVEQDVFLFDGTVAENIGYARREASEEEIVRAAEVANAAEFVDELPNGYATLIGERGVRLSGGQRQRIAIARAVLADPRILILDEATSNLDTESERLIQQSLERLMADRTSFVIAHRLSTITDADRILVIDDGRIIESGTHEELLASGGRYREMVELQLGPREGVTVGRM